MVFFVPWEKAEGGRRGGEKVSGCYDDSAGLEMEEAYPIFIFENLCETTQVITRVAMCRAAQRLLFGTHVSRSIMPSPF